MEVKLSRYYGHFEGDQQTYRAPGEVGEIRRTRDCLDRFAERVTARDDLTAAELAAVDQDVGALIEEAVAGARAAPPPEPEDLLTDVYVRY